MKKLKKGEKGFTLVELLIALAITALVVTAATTAIIPILQSSSTTAHMSALRQVQTAGYWVSRDGIQSQTVTPGADSNFLNLTWTDWEKHTHQVEYSLQDMSPGSLKYLQRKEIIDEDGANPIIIITTVAQYLTNDTSCEPNDHTLLPSETLTFKVTATVIGARGPQTETRTYEIKPRPD